MEGLTHAESEVLQTLRQMDGAEAGAIAHQMSLKTSAVTKTLQGLRSKGVVEQSGTGWFSTGKDPVENGHTNGNGLAADDDTDTKVDPDLAASRAIQKKAVAASKAKAAKAKAKPISAKDKKGLLKVHNKMTSAFDKILAKGKKGKAAAKAPAKPKAPAKAAKVEPTHTDKARGGGINIENATSMKGPGGLTAAHKARPAKDLPGDTGIDRPVMLRNPDTKKTFTAKLPVINAFAAGKHTCPKCGQEKNAADFSARYSTVVHQHEGELIATAVRMYRQSQCRKCRAKRSAEKKQSKRLSASK